MIYEMGRFWMYAVGLSARVWFYQKGEGDWMYFLPGCLAGFLLMDALNIWERVRKP